jgi:hypothetical protein
MSNDINVELVRENPDGSAVFKFDLTEEQSTMFVNLGIVTALKAGIAEGKSMSDMPVNIPVDSAKLASYIRDYVYEEMILSDTADLADILDDRTTIKNAIEAYFGGAADE